MKKRVLTRILTILLLVTFIPAVVLSVAACSNKSGTQTTGSGSSASGATTGGSATASAATAVPSKPETVFQAYADAWQKFDYPAMYALLTTASQGRIALDAFVTRYKGIMTGIEAKSVQVKLSGSGLAAPPESSTADAAFTATLDCLAGVVDIPGYNLHLMKETVNGAVVWRVDWTEKMIFPKLGPTDKVRARVLAPLRGEIRDRNGQPLAINGQLRIIGLVPRTFAPAKATSIPQMAQILGIAESRVDKALSSAGNPDWFVPIVTLPADAKDLSTQLTALPGVQFQNTDGRIYPAGIAAGLLTGYIGPITAEELGKRPNEGYTATDKIGKLGLELAYEKRLRGQRGGEITIVSGDSSQVTSIVARKEPVNGDNIRISIDLAAQNRLYEQMGTDAGAGVALNPVTGEILALASTPSYDPNLYQTYIPDAVRAAWNTATKSPFTARFSAGYAPGSTFKLVTAAIGLKVGTLDPAAALPISGLQWQPNSSWGQYKVTRVKDLGKPVNLMDALVVSDNIYFAQQALKVGRDAYTKGTTDFGIGESLPLDLPFYRSQLANKGLTSDVLLADTAFGQGELLVSPLQMAMIYASLATKGDILTPVLEIKGEFAPAVWKSQAIAGKDIAMLTADLRQVVDNPSGSGHTTPAAKTPMLGKTGTAELKKSLTDTNAQENGWFIAMNTSQPRLVVAMLIEDVKGRGRQPLCRAQGEKGHGQFNWLAPGRFS